MARKPTLTTDKLKELGADKLAQLALEEAERNAGFRRQVKAAMAGKDGPEAIARLIDRRLSALERARSFIDWDKARAFRDDLVSLTDTIGQQLAPASPALAIQRLLRFIATHEQVFQRIDDSSGRIQDVYYSAIATIGDLTSHLNPSDADLLPDKMMAALGESTHGYLVELTDVVAPHLPQATLERWDRDLEAAIVRRQAEEAARKPDRWLYSMTSQWAEMRQTIARARGDVDLVIALESQKPSHMQDTLGMAAVLLEAGRATEALEWIRKPGLRGVHFADGIDIASQRTSLEAQILEALGEDEAAQSLRWRCFESGLSANILRQYLKRLSDFDDIEAEERAFALAFDHDDPDAALQFFLAWPRLDLAARLIVAHYQRWDGQDWHVLPKIVGLLEHEHPLAATILYRALLDDILARAGSKAYGHGARYLTKLAAIASHADADPGRPSEIVDHATYLAELKKDHARKSGFWGRVDGKFE